MLISRRIVALQTLHLPLMRTRRPFRYFWPNHQILHQKGFMTFENRSWRDLDPEHLFFDFDPRRDLASDRLLPLLLRLRRRGAFLHAAWLDVRAAFQTFQPRDLFAQLGDGLLQGGDFTEQFNQQSFNLWAGQHGKGGGRRHMVQRVRRTESEQAKSEVTHTFAPLTAASRNPLINSGIFLTCVKRTSVP
jgi:hypothetical protein